MKLWFCLWFCLLTFLFAVGPSVQQLGEIVIRRAIFHSERLAAVQDRSGFEASIRTNRSSIRRGLRQTGRSVRSINIATMIGAFIDGHRNLWLGGFSKTPEERHYRDSGCKYPCLAPD